MKTRIVLSLVAISLVWMPYVHSASFDCAKAKTKIDKLVCGDPKLSELDEKLSGLYKKALDLSPVPEDSKDQQRDWVKGSRNTCKDAACLEEAYTSRISELEKDLKNLPFKPSLEKPLLTLPARPPEEQIDATEIVKKEPLELTGRISLGHDPAGARCDVVSAKRYYPIRYLWELTDAQNEILDKIEGSNQYVVLKGQLVTYKDGSKAIDQDSIVEIFGQSP